jgi:RNA polymerase sigma-70 factor (ECF subfamily)
MDTESQTRIESGATDRELVQRMLAGDELAFDQFSESYVPALYRFALNRLSPDRELTREIVQATLCKAISKLDSFRGEAALMTWMGTICRNEIAMHFRRQARGAQEVELTPEIDHFAAQANYRETGNAEYNLIDKEKASLVHMALDLLPPHYGRALEWKYLEDLSVTEIAARLELSPKATESLLTRARNQFRDHHDQLLAASGNYVEAASTGRRRAVSES